MKKHSKQLLKISLVTFSILALFPILSSNADIGQALAQAQVVDDSSYNISSNSLTRVMCNALRLVTGSAGKTFAAFAIIATGIGFFTGKVSWGFDDWCDRWYRHHVWCSFNCSRDFWTRYLNVLWYKLKLNKYV